MLNDDQARRVKAVGVDTVNRNLNTSENFHMEMIRDAGFVLESADGRPLNGDPLDSVDSYLATKPAVVAAAVEGPHAS